MSDDFFYSNQVFNGMLKYMKQMGKDKTKHIPAISEPDLKILCQENSLDVTKPAGLLHRVWFDIHYNFARRGCENDVHLTKDSFVFNIDENGEEYVEMNYNEATKNHPGCINDNDTSKPRMYSNNTETCPVAFFKKYMSKLNPDLDRLWQRPRKNAPVSDLEPWYTAQPCGKNTLAKMMKVISKSAKLSTVYTNHSVRAAAITTLSNAGIETRQIMHVTKHRNAMSLHSYNSDNSTIQKKELSRILQRPSSSSYPPSASAVTEPRTSTSAITPAVTEPRPSTFAILPAKSEPQPSTSAIAPAMSEPSPSTSAIPPAISEPRPSTSTTPSTSNAALDMRLSTSNVTIQPIIKFENCHNCNIYYSDSAK